MSQGRVLSKREEVDLADEVRDIFLELWCMGLPLLEAKRQLRRAINDFTSYNDLAF